MPTDPTWTLPSTVPFLELLLEVVARRDLFVADKSLCYGCSRLPTNSQDTAKPTKAVYITNLDKPKNLCNDCKKKFKNNILRWRGIDSNLQSIQRQWRGQSGECGSVQGANRQCLSSPQFLSMKLINYDMFLRDCIKLSYFFHFFVCFLLESSSSKCCVKFNFFENYRFWFPDTSRKVPTFVLYSSVFPARAMPSQNEYCVVWLVEFCVRSVIIVRVWML